MIVIVCITMEFLKTSFRVLLAYVGCCTNDEVWYKKRFMSSILHTYVIHNLWNYNLWHEPKWSYMDDNYNLHFICDRSLYLYHDKTILYTKQISIYLLIWVLYIVSYHFYSVSKARLVHCVGAVTIISLLSSQNGGPRKRRKFQSIISSCYVGYFFMWLICRCMTVFMIYMQCVMSWKCVISDMVRCIFVTLIATYRLVLDRMTAMAASGW